MPPAAPTDHPIPRVQRSWWLEEALAADPGTPCPPLVGDTDADVVVIGGGYVGMWAAYQIKERDPSLDVVLLEQDICGSGPSGRNGGFVGGWWEDIHEWMHRFGANEAMEMALTMDRSVSAIGEFCERHGVDAWWRARPEVTAATAAAHEGAWRPGMEAAERLGFGDAMRELSREEVRAICDSPTFRTGFLVEHAGTVQPARLARGLHRVILERGVRVHEHTAVRRLEASGSPVVAVTPMGSVRAKDAVLAINAWAGAWKEHRRTLAVRGSYMVMTEPAPERLAEINWTGGESVRDLRSTLNYLRTTPDGRIAFGAAAISPTTSGRVTAAYDYDDRALRITARSLVRMFPTFADVPIAAGWGGPIDVSGTYLPFFGTWPSGRVHYALGFTGNGVAPSHLAGNVLAELATGQRALYSRLAVARYRPPTFPPEPAKSAGMAVINVALRRVDDAAERGERAGWVWRFLSRLPRRLGYNLGP